jgi:hypothetical protein
VTYELEHERRAFARRAHDVLDALLGGELRSGAQLAFDLQPLLGGRGDWSGLLADAPGRLLDLPLLALRDLCFDGARDESCETIVLDAGVLTAAAIFKSEALRGAEAGHDPWTSVLLAPLVAGATVRACAAFANDGSCAERCAAAWTRHADAIERLGILDSRWARADAVLTYDVVRDLGAGHAPLVELFARAVHVCDRARSGPALQEVVEQAAGLHQLLRDIEAVHRDLARGWWSLPIARLAAAIGVPPRDGVPPAADAVLLSAMLTPTLPMLAAEAATRARELAGILVEHGLPRVAKAVGTLESGAQSILVRIGTPTSTPALTEPVAFRVSAAPRRMQAVENARRAMDDDPTWEETWVSVRVGRPSSDDEVDRLSAAALVVENRMLAGDDQSEAIDRLLRAVPDTHDPSTDALASLATLLPAIPASHTARHRIDAAILDWLASPRRNTCCMATLTHLAHALLEWSTQPEAALSLAREALERVAREGRHAFTHHDPLLGALRVITLAGAVDDRLSFHRGEALGWALAFSARWRGRAARSALAAAWLKLISTHSVAKTLYDSRWELDLLRSQRASGTWDPEPHLRGRPGHPAPAASRLVTSSFVYRALMMPPPHA